MIVPGTAAAPEILVRRRDAGVVAPAVAVLGCVLLWLRADLARAPSGPVPHLALLALLFGALLLAGVAWPLEEGDERLPRRWAAPLAAGAVVFALGRLLGPAHALMPFTARAVALNSLAAISEEAFFRRFLYGLLARHSAAVAVAGSAAAFALVHVSTYGGWVVPVDLAAGAVLGWQRWASRTWAVPAATHVVANLLAAL